MKVRLDYYRTLNERFAQITPADVQRVARQYFKEDQSTTGWFIPVQPTAEKGS